MVDDFTRIRKAQQNENIFIRKKICKTTHPTLQGITPMLNHTCSEASPEAFINNVMLQMILRLERESFLIKEIRGTRRNE